MYHRAKKSLGQNFLSNPAIIEKICAAANIVPTDTVLEIGPGKGVLTKNLVAQAGHVIAIEKDDALYSYLTDSFNDEIQTGKLELIHGDALEFTPPSLNDSRHPPFTRERIAPVYKAYKLVANIPYNITGAIIEKFLSMDAQPSMMVLMVQKEVAERIVAKDKKTGGPGKESILSIAIKAYGTPEYVFTVKAGSFTPAPSVDSAVIRISGISRNTFVSKHHEEVFFQIMKAGFAHKRKTLAGNLKNILEPEIVMGAFAAAGLRPAARAEDLGVSDWHCLSQFVYNAQYGISASIVI